MLDTHRRESFQIQRFGPEEAGKGTTLSDSDNSPPLAMRIIRPACQLKVHLAEGRPASLEGQQGERKRLQGNVLWSAGPWRSSGDWWTDNKNNDGPWDREEWDVGLTATSNAAEQSVVLYRIYQDLGTGKWFADASYD